MKAVILAGGRGTRISEESHLRPKPMVTIGDMPILWHIMKIYGAHGIHDFVICLGYRGYVIKEFFANFLLHTADSVTVDMGTGRIERMNSRPDPWRVSLVETGQLSETGGRIRRIRDWVGDDEAFCLTYGDGVADIDITSEIAFHASHGKLATVAAVSPPGRFGAISVDGEMVTRFAEKPDVGNQVINGGFFVLSPKVIDYIEGDRTVWEREPLQALAQNRELAAYRHDGFWHPMDTMRDREQLETMWASGNAPWRVWRD